tara:strand:- start:263 stop:520 length:258 start_codon:yes stop_codon:yes gene_type:complete
MSIENHYRHISIHNYDRDDKTMLQGSIDELTARGCAELLEDDELKALAQYHLEKFKNMMRPMFHGYDAVSSHITIKMPDVKPKKV